MPIGIDPLDAVNAAHAVRQAELAQRTAAARQQLHGLTGIQIAQAATAGAVPRADAAALSPTGQSAMSQAVLAAAALIAAQAASVRIGEAAGGFLASGFGARADRDFADMLERNLMRPLRDQLQAAIAVQQADGGDLTQGGYLVVRGVDLTAERGGAVQLGGGGVTVADAATLAGLYDRRGRVLTYVDAAGAAGYGAPGVIDTSAGGLDWGRLNPLINNDAVVDPAVPGFELAREAGFGFQSTGRQAELARLFDSGAIWMIDGDSAAFFPFAGGGNRGYNPEYFDPLPGDKRRHGASLFLVEGARIRDGGIDARLDVIQPFTTSAEGAA